LRNQSHIIAELSNLITSN